MLDWIFEGIATWVASVMTQIMDAISGVFIGALGTDMTAMEEYFPFAVSAYSIIQYTAWALLFLVVVWQIFRAFSGPLAETENPLTVLARGAIFGVLISYAKPIFSLALDIARAPYTALMDSTLDPGDFTFAGIEQALTNGLTTLVSVATVVGLILLIILMIALAWNYFKLLQKPHPGSFKAGAVWSVPSFCSWYSMFGFCVPLTLLLANSLQTAAH